MLVTFQGCDVRPLRVLLPARHACSEPLAGPRPGVTEHADRVLYLNPDLASWLPGAEFFPYANVDPRAVEPAPGERREELVVATPPPTVDQGHAHVIDAVEVLRDEGMAVRLDLIEGVTHDEVRRESRGGRRGRPAGARLVRRLRGRGDGAGRPVVCFIREEDNPFGEALPIVRATPSTLVERLRELLRDPARRREAGQVGRRFVEREHDPLTLARRALAGLVDLP